MTQDGLLRFERFLDESEVPLRVGRATISWNTLSGAMFQMYHLLSEMDEETAKVTFFPIASDRSQRDMVSNLVELKLRPHSPTLANQFQTVIGEANKLAGKRNDILHVVFVGDESPATVSQMHERGHLKNKTGAELMAAIHKFTMDALTLAGKADEIRGRVGQLPRYKNLMLAEALLQYRLERTPEELASQGEYGLLTRPATILGSLPETEGH
jgi:hypothetical protein